MATGPEHYREGERFADLAENASSLEAKVANAQLATAHALLANAAATALNDHAHDEGGMPLEDYDAWLRVAGVFTPRRKGGEGQ